MAPPHAHLLKDAIGPQHKLGALIASAAALATGALLGVAWSAGFGRVWRTLVYPHWIWFPVAIGCEALAYLGYTLAYRETVRAEGGAELRTPSAVALVTTGFGVFLQGGGFALDREALKRAGLRESDARARVLGLGALEYSVLGPVAAVAAAIVLIRDGQVGLGVTLPWIIGLPVGAAIALTALRHRRALEGRSGWRAGLAHALAAVDLVLRMLRAPRSYGLAFLGIGLYWAGDVFCLWATLHAFFAHPPPLAELLLGYATGYAITRRALPLGGAGVVEALLPFALGWVGIALPQALLAVAAYRIINLWLPMIPALAAIPALAQLEAQPASR
jgi:uncharacterized membrane protein YbhN (UPF0104 family)